MGQAVSAGVAGGVDVSSLWCLRDRSSITAYVRLTFEKVATELRYENNRPLPRSADCLRLFPSYGAITFAAS